MAFVLSIVFSHDIEALTIIDKRYIRKAIHTEDKTREEEDYSFLK